MRAGLGRSVGVGPQDQELRPGRTLPAYELGYPGVGVCRGDEPVLGTATEVGGNHRAAGQGPLLDLSVPEPHRSGAHTGRDQQQVGGPAEPWDKALC